MPSATWLVRMPLVATFAAEVAKLRGVLLQIEARTQNYFFWLFVAQAVLEAGLALWACTIACPPRSLLDASRELQSAYEVRSSAPMHEPDVLHGGSLPTAQCTPDAHAWPRCADWRQFALEVSNLVSPKRGVGV